MQAMNRRAAVRLRRVHAGPARNFREFRKADSSESRGILRLARLAAEESVRRARIEIRVEGVTALQCRKPNNRNSGFFRRPAAACSRNFDRTTSRRGVSQTC